MRAVGHRERAANRAQLTGKAKLAGEFQLSRDFDGPVPTLRGSDGDGQIESPALLRKIRRREVDGHAPVGRSKFAV
jgi:hypothetical protein